MWIPSSNTTKKHPHDEDRGRVISRFESRLYRNSRSRSSDMCRSPLNIHNGGFGQPERNEGLAHWDMLPLPEGDMWISILKTRKKTPLMGSGSM